MNFRRAAKDDYVQGTDAGSLKGLFQTMEVTDIWLNVGA